jgi:hypothetical protein
VVLQTGLVCCKPPPASARASGGLAAWLSSASWKEDEDEHAADPSASLPDDGGGCLQQGMAGAPDRQLGSVNALVDAHVCVCGVWVWVCQARHHTHG